MDVTFVANDTRGGVEPYLALAAEAARRGQVVRAAAPPQYEGEFQSAGARFIPLLGAQQAQQIAQRGRISLREMSRRVVELTAQWAKDVAAEVDGTDLVVSGIGGMALAGPVAQAVGAPMVRAHLQPLDAPSTRYAGPLGSQLGALGPLGRRLSHTLTAFGTSVLTRAPERAARSALGLGREQVPPAATIVYGFSEAVVPVASDARTRRIATGYWMHGIPEEIDPRLREFVEAGGPIVSVGFGSMTTADPGALRKAVVAAGRSAGARLVLITGWGAIDEPEERDDDVLTVPSAPHAWLFPRMSAIVHHGGAGTTGGALSAGKPSVIVPFGADQPFWAARAHRLGVSPMPISRSRLTAEKLANALRRALGDSRMRQRADVLGQIIRRDRGVENALDAFENVAATTGRR